MITFLAFTLPTLIILLPIIMFSIYRLTIKTKIRRKIIVSSILFLLLGLIVPWIATFVSANGLASGIPDDQPKCVTGAAMFFFYGYLINLIGIPFFAVIFYFTDSKN